jgi:hypothetical protein
VCPAFIDCYAAFGDNYYIARSGSQVRHDQAYFEASDDEREGRLTNRTFGTFIHRGPKPVFEVNRTLQQNCKTNSIKSFKY